MGREVRAVSGLGKPGALPTLPELSHWAKVCSAEKSSSRALGVKGAFGGDLGKQRLDRRSKAFSEPGLRKSLTGNEPKENSLSQDTRNPRVDQGGRAGAGFLGEPVFLNPK